MKKNELYLDVRKALWTAVHYNVHFRETVRTKAVPWEARATSRERRLADVPALNWRVIHLTRVFNSLLFILIQKTITVLKKATKGLIKEKTQVVSA